MRSAGYGCTCLILDVFGRGEHLAHQSLKLDARRRADIKAGFLHIGEECRIFHGRIERLAQGCQTVCRDTRGGDVRAPEYLLGGDQFGDLFLDGILVSFPPKTGPLFLETEGGCDGSETSFRRGRTEAPARD